MKKLILPLVLVMSFMSASVNADMFVPDFATMPALQCEISETIYNQDNSVVTHNKYHRIFRIDDPAKKVYLNKAPVDKLITIDNEKIEMQLQTLTDDTIILEKAALDRVNNTYSSTSQISYDSAFFAPRYAKAQGICKPVN